MIKKIAIGLIVFLVLVLLGANFLPGRLDVSATRVIAAESVEIHPLIENFRSWPAWSVWQEEDPTLSYEYSGEEKGVDAKVTWNGKSGKGGMTGTASDPARGFWYDLTFGEPGSEMESKGAVTYAPDPKGTLVTFSMNGELQGPIGKLMGVFMSPVVEASFAGNLENIAGIIEGK